MIWRLFLDDEKLPPKHIENDFKIARSYTEALSLMEVYGMPTFISFDYDLGPSSENGFTVAKHIVNTLSNQGKKFPKNFSFVVHSSSTLGSTSISNLLNNAILRIGKNA